jgi:hypothetical protein
MKGQQAWVSRIHVVNVSHSEGEWSWFCCLKDEQQVRKGLGRWEAVKLSRAHRWMPRHQEAMKDVAGCDKHREAAKQALIR